MASDFSLDTPSSLWTNHFLFLLFGCPSRNSIHAPSLMDACFFLEPVFKEWPLIPMEGNLKQLPEKCARGQPRVPVSELIFILPLDGTLL
jgi:hypothetical protein